VPRKPALLLESLELRALMYMPLSPTPMEGGGEFGPQLAELGGSRLTNAPA